MTTPSRPDPRIRRSYADFGRGQIHYRIMKGGSANALPPLLLLHPTPKSGWIFESIMPLLAATGRTVIAPDTPGYGASDALPATPSIADYCVANFSLIDRLTEDGIVAGQSCDVLGYHTGSVTASAMAITRPQAIRRIVAVSLPIYDAAERSDRMARLKSWPGPADDGSHLDSMWKLVGSLCDDRAITSWRHRSVAENLRADHAPAGYAAVYGYDLMAALKRIAQPMFVLNPQDDLFEVTRRIMAIRDDIDYRELPGVKHGLFEFDAPRLTGLIAAFLDRA